MRQYLDILRYFGTNIFCQKAPIHQVELGLPEVGANAFFALSRSRSTEERGSEKKKSVKKAEAPSAKEKSANLCCYLY
jgi:hypothetical protein